MASLGETEIVAGSTTIGRIRVLRVSPDLAVFPRLAMDIALSLFEPEPRSPTTIPSDLTNLELRDAFGELRLSENADIIASAIWNEPHRAIRAVTGAFEAHLKFVCDLDFWRLEQIERRRAGAAPQLWLQVWPDIVSNGVGVECRVTPIRMEVPREQWLDFYSKVGGTLYEVLEVHYAPAIAEQFKRALARTREARAKITEGEYDEAVGLCRNVIEALAQELRPDDVGEDPLRALFVARTDDRRAKEYVGIVSRLKQLAAFAHHEIGEAVAYSREEATFIVRVTESLLALVGRLSTGT